MNYTFFCQIEKHIQKTIDKIAKASHTLTTQRDHR